MAKKSSYVAPMQPTPIIGEPFDKVTIDIIGDIKMTKQKNRFLLTYIDHSTRYPDTVPVRTTTSKDVANVLLQIFSRLSVPLEILTDRGANFISDFMKEVYKFMRIRHIKTAPYCPQSNGCLERFLMPMVRKCKDEDWDTAFPYFLFACRDAVSSSTGFTPFELLYGKNVHGPLDVLHNQWVPMSKTSLPVLLPLVA